MIRYDTRGYGRTQWLADFEPRFWVDGPGQPPDRVHSTRRQPDA